VTWERVRRALAAYIADQERSLLCPPPLGRRMSDYIAACGDRVAAMVVADLADAATALARVGALIYPERVRRVAALFGALSAARGGGQ
jgi:hypothetical protein